MLHGVWHVMMMCNVMFNVHIFCDHGAWAAGEKPTGGVWPGTIFTPEQLRVSPPLRAPCQPQLSFVRLRSKSGRSSGAAESPLQRRGPHPGDAQVSTSRTRGVSRDTCQRMSNVHYGCSHVTHSSMYWIFIVTVDADLDSYAPVPVSIPARERA